MANKGGRPPKYKTKATFTRKVNDYFQNGGSKTKDRSFTLYSVQGLCVYCDISRQTLSRYKSDERFSDTIKKALLRIEQNNLEGATLGYLNPTMTIFNLKNNFGWKDSQQIDHSGSVNILVQIPGVENGV